jgi:hypothetical protein
MERQPNLGLGLVMAQHALGNHLMADRLEAELLEKHSQDAAYNIAFVMAYRERPDEAFEWLQKAVTNGDPGLADVAAEPLFQSLHSDARWLPFLESVGKAPSQLDAISFEVSLPRP